jgi:leucine dehydrogenase
MTYKNAISGIPYGGGKAVVIADPAREKTHELLRAMGDFVDSLKGRYITSFDSGTTLSDLSIIGERTSFVAGNLPGAGNASATTAAGVYHCILAAMEMRTGRAEIAGARIAIQGIGNVGGRLARMLAADGAQLILADIDDDAAQALASELSAEVAPTDHVHQVAADVFSPCALGAVLSERTIAELGAKIVVGAANNQLATRADDQRLADADILYCPDYLANAGGIVDLHYQRSKWDSERVDAHVRGLAHTFRAIVDQARMLRQGTTAIADRIAEDRIRRGRRWK